MARTGFENLRVYQLAEEVADLAWVVVNKWDHFTKTTMGKQLVNAADSIGANIAEGTGRGSFADNRRFAKIARASLFEVKHWLRRAYKRELLSETEITSFRKSLDELTPKLSAYINSIGQSGQSSVVSGQSPVVNGQLSVVSRQLQPTTNNGQPTTDNRQQTTDNKQLTTGNKQIIWRKNG